MDHADIAARVKPRANVYFGGRCVSHSLQLDDGQRVSVGVILPGEALTFRTAVAERMQGVGGACAWRMLGTDAWQRSGEGDGFDVPANSAFEIRVEGEPYHYVCRYVAP